MSTISNDLKVRFREYVQEVGRARQNLAFLLDNLVRGIELDFNADSLSKVERVYWDAIEEGLPSDLTDAEHFAHLIGQVLAQVMVESIGARIVQSTDKNPMFGQPCLDGFGNEKWERVYPVQMALQLPSLPQSQPSYPGVREKRVFAAAFEKAQKIYSKRKSTQDA